MAPTVLSAKGWRLPDREIPPVTPTEWSRGGPFGLKHRPEQGMAAYGLGIGANIDAPIKDRNLCAMVWMTAPHRLIALRPFAQIVEGWVHHDVEKRARPPAGADHGLCTVGCRKGDGRRCQVGSPP